MENSKLETVLEHIASADTAEIHRVMDAVRERIQSAFPDWEIIYLAIPRHNAVEREKTLEFLLRCFNRQT